MKFIKLIFIISIITTSIFADRGQVEGFVERFYVTVLDRDSEQAGLDYWSDNLISGSEAGADIARGFIFSEEFMNRETTNDEFLYILYRAFFNREPDRGGFETWTDDLNSRRDRNFILDGFLYSEEFSNLCKEYGIEPTERIANIVQDNSKNIEESFKPISLSINNNSSDETNFILKGAGDKNHQTQIDNNNNITQLKYSDRNNNITIFYDENGNPIKINNNLDNSFIIIDKKDANTIDYLFYQNNQYISTDTIEFSENSYSVNSILQDNILLRRSISQRSIGDIGVLIFSIGIASLIVASAPITVPSAALLVFGGMALMTGDAVKERADNDIKNFEKQLDGVQNCLNSSTRSNRSLTCNLSKIEIMNINSLLMMQVDEEAYSSTEIMNLIVNGVDEKFINFAKENIESLENIDETTIPKTCQSDAYECPICTDTEELIYQEDGSGVCNDIKRFPDSGRQMSWIEATNYCAKLGGRLPTINELINDYNNKIEGYKLGELYPYLSDSPYSVKDPYSSFIAFQGDISIFYFMDGIIFGTNKERSDNSVRCFK